MAEENSKYSKEDAYRTLELTNSWIGNVDTKTSFGLAFIVALLALIFYNAGSAPSAIQDFTMALKLGDVTVCIILRVILIALLYIFSFASIAMFCFAIMGRTKNVSDKKSIIFFGNIANMPLNDFKAKTCNMNDKEITRDLLEQIHINSKICSVKFFYYSKGLYSLIVSVILYFVCMVFNLI